MKFLHLFSTLSGLTLPFTASAVQLFSNTGTTSGWSNIQTEASGTVQQVTNVVREGSTALKMTQTYDSSYSGLYHSEVHAYNAYSQGDMRFYGFWFRLSENWEFTPSQGFNIAQFIAQFPGTCDTYAPSTMVWIRGNQLYTRYKYGPLCGGPTTVNSAPLATVEAGVWHKIVIQARWESNTNGYLKLWFDGNKVYEETGIRTTYNENSPFQFRVGLYANTWPTGYVAGSQTFRQIWFDEIAYGTTFADADPSQW